MKTKKSYLSEKFRSMFVAATFSMLVEYIMNLTDKVIAGNLLPAAALPALTLAEPLTLIIAFVSCVLSAGVGVQVSEALGKGDQKRAEQQFSQGLILAVGIGAVITAIYLAFSEQIVAALSGGGTESGYMASYFRYARLLPIPMLLNAVVYPIVLYRGGEKYCNYSAVVSVVGNIGVTLALVFSMGMEGISLGTVIGSWAGLVPLAMFLLTSKGRMRLCFHLSMKDIRGMGVYSIGNSIIYLYMAIFQACMNTFLLSRYGSSAIVVFTGVVNLSGLFAALSDGIGEFLLPMINMYRGEENVIGEKRTMLISVKASVAAGVAITAFTLVFAGLMPTLFGVDDPAIRGDFMVAARIYALCASFLYMLNIYVKYYLFVGKTANSLVLSLCLNLVFPLAFGVLGGLVFGMNGVWIGMSASHVLLQAAAYLLIRTQKGADKLCMFLDRERESRQRCWDAVMTQEGITGLMDSVEGCLKENGIDRSRINKVLLAIEETQMDDLAQNKSPEKVLIECTLFLEEEITLVLRNTGINRNPTQEASDPANLPRYQILSGMQNKSYILVNGSNRLIFRF